MSPNQTPATVVPPVIALTGGGSGGHITPLLSLARALKVQSPDCLIVYIGPKGDKLNRLQDKYAVFDEVYYVPAGKFRRYHGESFLSHLFDVKTLFLNFVDFFKVVAGIASSLRILKKTNPQVVFSKGGFVAVPVGIAAKFRGISIVTHDSDVVPGLANRIIGRWAAVHATGQPARYYKYPKDSIKYIGIPIDDRFTAVDDSQRQNYKQQLGLKPNQPVILISGGGLGAQSLNKSIIAAAPEIFKNNPDLAILHICGQQHAEEVSEGYKALLGDEQAQRVRVVGFTTEFYIYSAVADLVVTRAGATTLAELAAQAKACLLVPSPHLTGGHQIKNARLLQEAGAAEVIPNNATPLEFSKTINQLLGDKQRLSLLANKLASTAKTDAAAALADILVNLATKK